MNIEKDKRIENLTQKEKNVGNFFFLRSRLLLSMTDSNVVFFGLCTFVGLELCSVVTLTLTTQKKEATVGLPDG